MERLQITKVQLIPCPQHRHGGRRVTTPWTGNHKRGERLRRPAKRLKSPLHASLA